MINTTNDLDKILNDWHILEYDNVCYYGAYNAPYESVEFTENESPTFEIKTIDANKIPRNSQVEIKDIGNFKVVGKQPDGQGLSVLILSKN